MERILSKTGGKPKRKKAQNAEKIMTLYLISNGFVYNMCKDEMYAKNLKTSKLFLFIQENNMRNIKGY